MDHGSPTVQLPKLSPLLLELTSFLASVQGPQSSSPSAALPRPRRGPDATPTWLPLLDLPPLTLRAPQLQEGFPGGTSGKEPTCQCRRCKRHRFDPWVRKILWRKKWQPTPVFLCGKSHGQRSWQATVQGVTNSQTRLTKHTQLSTMSRNLCTFLHLLSRTWLESSESISICASQREDKDTYPKAWARSLALCSPIGHKSTLPCSWTLLSQC